MPLEKICKHRFTGACKDYSKGSRGIDTPCEYTCSDYEEMEIPTTETRKSLQEDANYKPSLFMNFSLSKTSILS